MYNPPHSPTCNLCAWSNTVLNMRSCTNTHSTESCLRLSCRKKPGADRFFCSHPFRSPWFILHTPYSNGKLAWLPTIPDNSKKQKQLYLETMRVGAHTRMALPRHIVQRPGTNSRTHHTNRTHLMRIPYEQDTLDATIPQTRYTKCT